VKLVVELGASNAAVTPAAVEQKEKLTRQQQAEEAIKQDPFVREAQAVLGAQIVESSIKPLQQ
jgi:DNA polymerase-3 subunit gamma/tau